MFDPYHKWLGIPKDQRPPTFYQLLGITPGEDDVEVIEEAAIRQTTHVRAYQIGAHAQECTRLLNEISQARSTLTNPAKRKQYDAALGQKSKPAMPATASPPAANAAEMFAKLDSPELIPVGNRPPLKAGPSSSKKSLLYLGAGGAVVAVLAIVLIVILSGKNSDNQQAQNTDKGKSKEKLNEKKDLDRDRKKDPIGKINKEKVVEVKKDGAGKQKEIIIGPMPEGPSPLDKLDSEKIVAKDRLDTIPELVAVLRGPQGEIFAVAFSPDSKKLACTGNDGQVYLWTLEGAEFGPATKFGTGGRPMSSLAFSSDGKMLGFANDQRTWIFDISMVQPKQVQAFDLRTTLFAGVAFSPDGNTFVVTDIKGFRLLDLSEKTKARLVRGHAGLVPTVYFSKDGGMLLSAGTDGTARLWDMKALPPKEKTVLRGSSLYQAVLSPDAKAVATGSRDGLVEVWDITGPEPEKRWSKKEHRHWANSVSFAPDGKTLISTEGGASSIGPHYLIWWNAANGEVLKKWQLPERCSQGVFAPTGMYVALTNHNRKVYILRLKAAEK